MVDNISFHNTVDIYQFSLSQFVEDTTKVKDSEDWYLHPSARPHKNKRKIHWNLFFLFYHVQDRKYSLYFLLFDESFKISDFETKLLVFEVVIHP